MNIDAVLTQHIVYGIFALAGCGLMWQIHKDIKQEKRIKSHNQKLEQQARDWMSKNKPQPPNKP
ncbi:hypothetical protein [Aeromonas phage SW69-9]|nr:hypothetical protein [Aeromonas phage SW69-9]